MVYATTNRVLQGVRQEQGHELVLMQSASNPAKFYRVDITHGRCNCPAWINSKSKAPCKHLKALGFVAVNGDVPVSEPKKVQDTTKNLNYQTAL